MRLVQRIFFANFLFSALYVFAYTGYAKLIGLSINKEFMGFKPSGRAPDSPAWTTPLVIECILVCWGLMASDLKSRVLVVGFCAWGILSSFVVPMLHEQVYGTKLYSFDRAIWWYACISTMMYALIKPHRGSERSFWVEKDWP